MSDLASWAPNVPSDARHRAVGILNQEPAVQTIPLGGDRALAFSVMYAGDQLKRIADLLEQSTRPLPGRSLEPGRKTPQRGLILLDGGARR